MTCKLCKKRRATEKDSRHYDAADYEGLCWWAFYGRCVA